MSSPASLPSPRPNERFYQEPCRQRRGPRSGGAAAAGGGAVSDPAPASSRARQDSYKANDAADAGDHGVARRRVVRQRSDIASPSVPRGDQKAVARAVRHRADPGARTLGTKLPVRAVTPPGTPPAPSLPRRSASRRQPGWHTPWAVSHGEGARNVREARRIGERAVPRREARTPQGGACTSRGEPHTSRGRPLYLEGIGLYLKGRSPYLERSGL